MKKILFLTMVLLVMSGCSQNQISQTKENMEDKNISTNEEKFQGVESNLTAPITTTPDSLLQENIEQQATQAVIKTNLGDITLKFYAKESPLTVANFLDLAKKGFYNGTKFHRVIKDFMIQGGDPLSKDDDWSNDGTGGPGYKFKDEINNYKLVRGSLAMANSGPDTNGSQFFVVTAEATPWLDGKHTNFGYVESGMEVIDKIEAAATNENDHPLEDIVVENITLLNINN